MKSTIVALFDRKAQTFISLEPTPHIGVATRSLTEVVNNPEHNIGKWPEDFSLWELGTFDTETGEITVLKTDSGNPTKRLITECEALKRT